MPSPVSRLGALWLLCLCSAHAQTLQVITLADHEQRLPQLAAIVQTCLRDTTRCTAAIPDESFSLPDGVQTHVSYTWLRNGMASIAKAKPEARERTANILLEQLRAVHAPQTSPVAASRARVEADAVLSQVEFAKTKPSILREQWQRFLDWLNGRLSSSSAAHDALPWLRFLLQAALFGIPLLLVGLWLLRQVREDRLRPTNTRDRAQPGTTGNVSWLDTAQQHARAGEWRDAVHALYWHTITGFEQRRVWSVARHRTPREYLRLLEVGSHRRSLLRELTLLLEHVWYGNTAATEADFQRARRLSEELAA